MSKIKLSLLDKKIAQFADSSTELLTGIQAGNMGGNRGASDQKRRMQKSISMPDQDMDPLDEGPFGL